jgi:hypothetical protein
MKPRGLLFTLVAMCIFNLTGFLFIDSNRMHAVIVFVLISTVILAGYFVLFFYWQGRNWARILVMLNSLLALYNVHLIVKLAPLQRLIVLSEAALGAYLLYWLNTGSIREYFKGPHATDPDVPNPAN